MFVQEKATVDRAQSVKEADKEREAPATLNRRVKLGGAYDYLD